MTSTSPTTALRIIRATKLRPGRVVFWCSAVVLAIVVLCAIFAPLVAPFGPDDIDYAAINSGPTATHWFGADNLGRDLLSRTIWGARTALLGPLVVVILSTIIGMLLGLAAAWTRGWLDAVLSRVFDVLFAFPALLIAIIGVALFGKGLLAPVIAMSIAYAPYVARLTRTLVQAERSRPYVASYRVQGFSGPWIALWRVLPNVMPVVGAQSTLNFGYVLAELAGLSFLGLGVQPPAADWGAMINEAKPGIVSGSLLPVFVPALAVVLVVVAINIIGEELSNRVGGGSAS